MSEILVKVDEKDLALIAGLGIAFAVFTRKEDSVPKINSGDWMPPPSADKYLHLINKATRDYSLPPKLLGRLLYQESRFRDDIISGKTVSRAGAVGIAQIVPKWHPDINPLDVAASIDYAAKYLRNLFNRFGNWGDALAAYNWGQGNLSKYKQGLIAKMPSETVNYVNEISRDVLV